MADGWRQPVARCSRWPPIRNMFPREASPAWSAAGERITSSFMRDPPRNNDDQARLPSTLGEEPAGGGHVHVYDRRVGPATGRAGDGQPARGHRRRRRRRPHLVIPATASHHESWEITHDASCRKPPLFRHRAAMAASLMLAGLILLAPASALPDRWAEDRDSARTRRSRRQESAGFAPARSARQR